MWYAQIVEYYTAVKKGCPKGKGSNSLNLRHTLRREKRQAPEDRAPEVLFI